MGSLPLAVFFLENSCALFRFFSRLCCEVFPQLFAQAVIFANNFGVFSRHSGATFHVLLGFAEICLATGLAARAVQRTSGQSTVPVEHKLVARFFGGQPIVFAYSLHFAFGLSRFVAGFLPLFLGMLRTDRYRGQAIQFYRIETT